MINIINLNINIFTIWLEKKTDKYILFHIHMCVHAYVYIHYDKYELSNLVTGAHRVIRNMHLLSYQKITYKEFLSLCLSFHFLFKNVLHKLLYEHWRFSKVFKEEPISSSVSLPLFNHIDENNVLYAFLCISEIPTMSTSFFIQRNKFSLHIIYCK